MTKCRSLICRMTAAWHSGHRVRLQARRSWVRIQPRCKVFRPIYIAVLVAKLKMHCQCTILRKKTKCRHQKVDISNLPNLTYSNFVGEHPAGTVRMGSAKADNICISAVRHFGLLQKRRTLPVHQCHRKKGLRYPERKLELHERFYFQQFGSFSINVSISLSILST
jgi:hypothetical protein